jgi:hypothetical protein
MPPFFIPTTYFNSHPDTWSLRGFFAASTTPPAELEGLRLQHVVDVYVRTLSEIASGSLDGQVAGADAEAAERRRECASLLLTAYKQVCFGAAVSTSAWLVLMVDDGCGV